MERVQHGLVLEAARTHRFNLAIWDAARALYAGPRTPTWRFQYTAPRHVPGTQRHAYAGVQPRHGSHGPAASRLVAIVERFRATPTCQ
eukprot:578469-Amphidinium_carterae.1